MNLRPPKKKKRAKSNPQIPFPIPLNGTEEWPVYTAHLTDVGSCIIEPEEINAVHSMGFFGKGSLSRSYPSFGKPRYGAPPVVRNRQWLRRQEWLKEVKELNSTTSSNYKDTKMDILYEEKNMDSRKENLDDIVEIYSNSTTENDSEQNNEVNTKDAEVDEIVLDSAEEDDICVIANRNSDKCDDVCVITNITHDNQDCPEEEKDVEELCNLDYYDFKGTDDRATDDKNLHGTVLVLPDSDSETENYLQNIKPKIENDGFPVREALHLTFEETFFLMFGLGCLQVVHFDGSLIDINNAWLYFCKEKTDFLQKYVVYHYYRSKGWIVKSGIKYGGDFLIYKEGPPFYHASYIVIVEVVDADSLIVDSATSSRSVTWNSLFGLERLSETAAKVYTCALIINITYDYNIYIYIYFFFICIVKIIYIYI
ncbi:tRNA-splicing endonuclease subunit Sen2 [Harpegnathos saltator]|uniref:tRNA-splicing endonuclease subunit Sen2 n=1 Tax=Harpegnathos saltator TaxID=610380 RepID=E2B775_HARSA|nr:tRNA-splicing endonuclease subunit Sen2 [Harpegnathos saltator]